MVLSPMPTSWCWLQGPLSSQSADLDTALPLPAPTWETDVCLGIGVLHDQLIVGLGRGCHWSEEMSWWVCWAFKGLGPASCPGRKWGWSKVGCGWEGTHGLQDAPGEWQVSRKAPLSSWGSCRRVMLG